MLRSYRSIFDPITQVDGEHADVCTCMCVYSTVAGHRQATSKSTDTVAVIVGWIICYFLVVTW